MVTSPTPLSGVRIRLYDVALAEFRTHGFDGVPVASITRSAGVAKGTFFNHFPTKDHVLAEWLRQSTDAVLETLHGRRIAGTEAILAFLRAWTEALEKDRPLASAVIRRLPALPAPDEGSPHEEERIRGWIRDRLGEALPLRVPLHEVTDVRLAALIFAGTRQALEDWNRNGQGPVRAVHATIREQASFLLASAGLPLD